MAKYEIWAKMSGSKYLGEVEAESEEEALEKGEKLDPGHIGFCHQCADELSDGLETEKIEASLVE